MAFMAALPLLTAAAPSLINTFGGGGKAGGGGGAGVGPIEQTVKQETYNDIGVDTNVVGAPININIGGTQSANGSLDGGRFLDHGVDEQGLNAPFGVMQGTDTQQVGFNDYFASTPAAPMIPTAVWIGGGLVVAGVGVALLRRKT
jgi:hypothetical protein